MYKLLDEPEFDPTAGVLCSMKDEYGGRARIINDDHCYVLQQWISEARLGEDSGEGPHWKSVTHWFHEAAEALHDMVSLYDTIDDVPGAVEKDNV